MECMSSRALHVKVSDTPSQQEKIRIMFFHFLRISTIKEVRLRAPVSLETRLAWEQHNAPEPSFFRLQFDWEGGSKSAWNIMIMNKLLEFIRLEHDRCKDGWNIDWYNDRHIQYIILQKFE